MAVAHTGRLIRNLDQDRLRRVLRTLLRIEGPEGPTTRPVPHPTASSRGAPAPNGAGRQTDRAQPAAHDTARTH